MKRETTYYEELIAAYFAGEISPEDMELLSVWLTEDKDHLQLFEEYRRTWALTVKDSIASGVNLNDEWNELSAKLDSASSRPFHQKLHRKGVLITFFKSWKVAAGILTLLSIAAALFYLNIFSSKVIVTAEKGNLEQILPDGSVIHLYKGSMIEYNADFNKKNRFVKLEGEAYFNVVHDTNRPFIVAGNDARIEVLGTSFNVNTTSGKNTIQVILTTGKVSLYFNDNLSEKVILKPGEQAEISTIEKKIVTTPNLDPNYMAWKTGVITFNNSGLDNVAATLEKVFQKPIKLENQQLANCRLTAVFDNQSLTSVLHVIQATLDIEIKQENGLILLGGKGCN